MDKILIKEVKNNSIAEEVGIESGDFLISINHSLIHDIIEYKYLITDEELLLEIQKKDGDYWEIEIQKEYDEDLGIVFENSIIDTAKGCSNKCIFCFIDQLPKGMRKSLYFKDDDTRLSFLQGNYVTLTNMKEEEIQRIIKYRIHPINISVHTTNPNLRKEMLNNKNAGKIMNLIDRFSKANLTMNAQIVLCPEINDGMELDNTLMDLSQYYPWIKSVSIVPVGISNHRENLYPLREFTREEAKIVIHQISHLQRMMMEKHGTNFAFPGDEFFIKAGMDFPTSEYYEGFGQLENGVGMVTILREQFTNHIKNIKKEPKRKKITIITGMLAYPYIKEFTDYMMDKWKQLHIDVIPIVNHFFGEKITVSGLITGQDIINQLKDKELGDYILIPNSMLKAEETIFLDDLSVKEVSDALNVPVYPTEVDGKALINQIFSIQS